ncbi:MAG: methylmalonyl-CoA epimerase [Planctomycetes bacterium]|nr:methylmalonyl-CoA epimerase [Planctomycetota bacterium]
MQSSGLDHIAIAVADLDRAVAFFRDILGLRHEGTEEVPTEGVKTAFFRAGAARIELVSPTAPGSAVSRFLERNGEGIHHIALRVDDIDAAMKSLKGAGLALTSDTPRPGAEGARITFIHPKSAHGVLVELKEEKE